jgi:hypothetical protein
MAPLGSTACHALAAWRNLTIGPVDQRVKEPL